MSRSWFWQGVGIIGPSGIRSEGCRWLLWKIWSVASWKIWVTRIRRCPFYDGQCFRCCGNQNNFCLHGDPPAWSWDRRPHTETCVLVVSSHLQGTEFSHTFHIAIVGAFIASLAYFTLCWSLAVVGPSAYPLHATLSLSQEIATSSGTSGKYRHTVQLYVLRALVYHAYNNKGRLCAYKVCRSCMYHKAKIMQTLSIS